MRPYNHNTICNWCGQEKKENRVVLSFMHMGEAIRKEFCSEKCKENSLHTTNYFAYYEITLLGDEILLTPR